jgi:predicted DNA-binding transcriptional regulator AlpA
MGEWVVTFEVKTRKTVDPEDVLEQLAEYFPAVSFGDGLLSTTVTVKQPTPMQAYDFVYEALAEAVPGRMEVERAEIMTTERQEEELSKPTFPEMVGLVEIADMTGRSRQRAYQMVTENKSFPAAIVETRSGRLWLKAAVERYLEERHIGRPRKLKTLTSQVGGAGMAAALSSKMRQLRPAANRRA